MALSSGKPGSWSFVSKVTVHALAAAASKVDSEARARSDLVLDSSDCLSRSRGDGASRFDWTTSVCGVVGDAFLIADDVGFRPVSFC